jgi:hypothetical protein
VAEGREQEASQTGLNKTSVLARPLHTATCPCMHLLAWVPPNRASPMPKPTKALECHIVTPDFDSAVLLKKQIWPPLPPPTRAALATPRVPRASKLQAAKRLAEGARKPTARQGRRGRRRRGAPTGDCDEGARTVWVSD